MSFEAMAWAIRQKLEPIPRLLLVALADRADKQGRCWPSVGYLAEFCGFHRSTILRELKKLTAKHLIEDTHERRGLTNQVKVWRLRLAEDSLPLPEPRRGKSRSIGDTLNGMKGFQSLETVSEPAKGRNGETVSGFAKGVRGGTGSPRRPVAVNAGKGITGATRNQSESNKNRTLFNGRKVAWTFDVAPDWQPPTLPDGSKVAQFIERWSPDEFGQQVERFKAKVATDGVAADLNAAWVAHVWRVELDGGV